MAGCAFNQQNIGEKQKNTQNWHQNVLLQQQGGCAVTLTNRWRVAKILADSDLIDHSTSLCFTFSIFLSPYQTKINGWMSRKYTVRQLYKDFYRITRNGDRRVFLAHRIVLQCSIFLFLGVWSPHGPRNNLEVKIL